MAPTARRLQWALAALCLALFAALAPRLRYPDLNLDYPFVDGDSHDWIANGLHYAGHAVRFSARPPLLPLALAALDGLGALAWWPVLALLLFLATVAGFYDLAARLVPPAAAFVAALVVLLDASVLGLTLEVMADVPAACLLLWSVRAFVLAVGKGDGAGAPAARPGPGTGWAAGDGPGPPARHLGSGAERAAGGGRGAPAAAGNPGPDVTRSDGGASRAYLGCGLLTALAALTQEAAVLLLPAAGATLLLLRRRALATWGPWAGALVVVLGEGAWLAVRRGVFAPRGYPLIGHLGLLGFHLSSWRYYLWSLVSLLGLPACLLLFAGIVIAAGIARGAVMGGQVRRRAEGRETALPPAGRSGMDGAQRSAGEEAPAGERGSAGGRGGATPPPRACLAAPAGLFVLLLFALELGFFAFLYRYDGKRLVVYALWPAGLLIAWALAPLARRADAGRLLARAGFSAVAAVAVGAAALPLPAPPYEAAWAALWPAPPLASPWALPGGKAGESAPPPTKPGGDGPEGEPGRAVVRLDLAKLARWSVFGQVARAWRNRPSDEELRRRLDPARVAGAKAALYLFDNPSDGGGRYRTITRLGNALSAPVRFVPRSALGPYWNLLGITPLGSLSIDYDLYRVALPGLGAGTWLLVTPGGHPLGRDLSGGGRGETGGGGDGSGAVTDRSAAAPRAPDGGAAAAMAAEIARDVGRGSYYVALIPPVPASGQPMRARPDTRLLPLYLIFLLDTTELYVIEPGDLTRTLGLLAQFRNESERRIGPARVIRTTIQGQATTVVSLLP